MQAVVCAEGKNARGQPNLFTWPSDAARQSGNFRPRNSASQLGLAWIKRLLLRITKLLVQ